MVVNYKQSFWTVDAGTGDLGPTKRAQIASAALTLQRVPHILHASSAGGYDDTEKPEIALTVPVDYDVSILEREVERALTDEGLPVKATLEQDVSWFDFGDGEMEAIQKATHIPSLPFARDAIYHLVSLPDMRPSPLPAPTNLASQLAHILSEFGAKNPLEADQVRRDGGHGTSHEMAARGTSSSGIPGSDLTQIMQIDEAKYARMKNARDGQVEAEVTGLKNALVELSNTTKTNSAVLIMIAGGLITVGSAMYKAYAAVQAAGSVSAMISGLIASIGGVAVLAGLVAVVAAIFLALNVFLKDAVNELVLVNGTQSKINLTKDWIINGERFKVTLEVPGAPDKAKIAKPMAYACGIYTYRKTRWWGQPVGFFGSNMGIAYQASDGTEFCVGMDCPNTALGGTNCIRVISGTDAATAANKAASTGVSTESVALGGHTCVASRASKWGSINYGICWIDQMLFAQ